MTTVADLDQLELDGDPIDPIGGGGALIGYARVSTRDQKLHRHIDALTAAGCQRIFEEKLSGKNTDRPELARCLDYLRSGDTIVVLELWRLGRSLQDLILIVGELRRRGIGFKSLHEALDTTTPGGRLVFHVFAALAEFIRELIVEGTNEGLAAARARSPAWPATGDDPGADPVRPHLAHSARGHSVLHRQAAAREPVDDLQVRSGADEAAATPARSRAAG